MQEFEAIESAVIREEDTPWRVFGAGPAPRLWTPLMHVNEAWHVADEARERLIAANLWNCVEVRFTPCREMCAVEIILKK